MLKNILIKLKSLYFWRYDLKGSLSHILICQWIAFIPSILTKRIFIGIIISLLIGIGYQIFNIIRSIKKVNNSSALFKNDKMEFIIDIIAEAIKGFIANLIGIVLFIIIWIFKK